jgi:hypothetical protein
MAFRFRNLLNGILGLYLNADPKRSNQQEKYPSVPRIFSPRPPDSIPRAAISVRMFSKTSGRSNHENGPRRFVSKEVELLVDYEARLRSINKHLAEVTAECEAERTRLNGRIEALKAEIARKETLNADDEERRIYETPPNRAQLPKMAGSTRRQSPGSNVWLLWRKVLIPIMILSILVILACRGFSLLKSFHAVTDDMNTIFK